jgi:hypothetical protein
MPVIISLVAYDVSRTQVWNGWDGRSDEPILLADDHACVVIHHLRGSDADHNAFYRASSTGRCGASICSVSSSCAWVGLGCVCARACVCACVCMRGSTSLPSRVIRKRITIADMNSIVYACNQNGGTPYATPVLAPRSQGHHRGSRGHMQGWAEPKYALFSCLSSSLYCLSVSVFCLPWSPMLRRSAGNAASWVGARAACGESHICSLPKAAYR